MKNAILNETEICVGGSKLIKHKKRSCYNEANEQLLSGKCFYYYGDGFSEYIDINDLSKYLMNTTRDEICLDNAVGIANDVRFYSDKLEYNENMSILELLMYIIQSNTIRPRDHMHNLPVNTFIDHADKDANISRNDCVYCVAKNSKQENDILNLTYQKMVDTIDDGCGCSVTIRSNLINLGGI